MNTVGFIIGIAGLLISIVMAFFYFRDRHPRLGKLKWKQIVNGALQLVSAVNKTSFKPEIIVAAHSQGIGFGAIVGEIIAVKMKLPFSVISIDIVLSREETASGAAILGIDREFVKGKRVLLVDDICNSGRTLRIARQELQSMGCEVKSAVILAPPEQVVTLTDIDYFISRSTTGQIYNRKSILGE